MSQKNWSAPNYGDGEPTIGGPEVQLIQEGGNCITTGLTLGEKYKITVTVKDDGNVLQK